ncbi:uncharacterized protein [Clytia hemisphaerica]|uniref:Uncharacterized protein n=1 Tax=Clytia hemisphaerica TaxID=252671 RepID=A0A7M5WLD2_9CNID
MCISGEIHDKYPPLIEFIIWMILQIMCIGNHFGVWALIPPYVIDITSPTYMNVTRLTNVSLLNDTSACDMLSGNTSFKNCTLSEIDKDNEAQWKNIELFRHMLLIFCIVAIVIFLVHAVLLIPNIIQGFRVKEPALLKETGNAYFQNVLKIHCFFLILETIVFDIPAGCLSMELLSQIWEGPLTQEENMRVSKMILTLSLVGLAFIALYKGMMPLYVWLGNPFCFPCIPLRILVVFPGGLIAMVMTFGPIMGVTKNRLLQFAPPVMQVEIGDMANTFFSIGMIFWGCFGIIGGMTMMCWYKFCRPGAEGEVCDVCCDA